MVEHGGANRLIVGLVLASILGACAASATSSPSPSAVPVRTGAPVPSPGDSSPPATPIALAPAQSATPGPTATASAYGEATLTSGTQECTSGPGANGLLFVCDARSNDPRVSGTETSTTHMRTWGLLTNGALVEWGTARLENAGGAWDGHFSGIFATGLGDIITGWYTGTGGYAGLSYFQQIRASATGSGYTTTGLIFPGTPPQL